jgi:ABC-type glutathione transport system ATPase component
VSASTWLSVDGLTVRYDHSPGARATLDALSFTVPQGSTLGIVGESGSGKTTLAKAIVGTAPVSSGSVTLGGTSVLGARGAERRALRRRIQLIPQNPYSSLNPRRTIGATIAEAIDPVGRRRERTLRGESEHWMSLVQLPVDALDRYPHEFSGGQRQRIAIARALAVQPELVIADEITSALDATVQKEVLALVTRLQSELGFTMLFVSHNMAVVQEVSDDVLVMLHGEIVEHAPVEQVFGAPSSDYTRTLLASIPGLPGFSID